MDNEDVVYMHDRIWTIFKTQKIRKRHIEGLYPKSGGVVIECRCYDSREVEYWWWKTFKHRGVSIPDTRACYPI